MHKPAFPLFHSKAQEVDFCDSLLPEEAAVAHCVVSLETIFAAAVETGSPSGSRLSSFNCSALDELVDKLFIANSRNIICSR